MFTLFQNFADLWLKNYPLLLISRIHAYLWKITPFFAKVGTSVVYVLIGGGGGNNQYYALIYPILMSKLMSELITQNLT